MSRDLPRIVIAGLRGGSGKTTMTLGLIQALRDRGHTVAPFKKGPDYIDPFWHTEAAGAACHNLDPYMMGRGQVVRSFVHHAGALDAAVVEGNRGLFDGKDAAGSHSTAELAKWLESPVVLVVDCSMASRTVAAVVLGCKLFDPGLNLAGVILNPVANPRQEKIIRKAVTDYCGLPVLGAVPRLGLNLPERHMGLVPPQEHSKVAEALHQAARSVAGYVDVDKLWSIMEAAPALERMEPPEGLMPSGYAGGGNVKIGVVRDAAFGFYYPENLEALVNHGARLFFCSALEDNALPQVDALYIGGGFPETHAERLQANQAFRKSIRLAAGQGMPIYAECGGMMYLGRKLEVGGMAYDMAGVFDIDYVMHKKPQGHGYTLCRVQAENPLFPTGYEFRAHEFHYSEPRPAPGGRPFAMAYQVLRGRGVIKNEGGLIYKNVLGTYHHVHCLGSPLWAPGMIAAARGHKAP